MTKALPVIFGDIKLAHTIFALPFALISAHLAFDGDYNFNTFILILGCMFFARSAAMAFNRYIDADMDAENPRTQGRSIPSGKVKRTDMLQFTVIMSVIFIILAAMLNKLTFILSFPALAIILLYSYSKRFTVATHLWLGLALGIAPVGAWVAIRGSFDIGPIILSAGVICWVAAFDILYALQDLEYDKAKGIISVPARTNPSVALLVARLLHAGTVAFFTWFGVYFSMGIAYWVGICFVVVLLLVEHGMVKPTDFSKVGYAFFTVNGIVSVLLLVCVILDKPYFIS
jgi:4-hydroxybenzoate polyprenyltransferase